METTDDEEEDYEISSSSSSSSSSAAASSSSSSSTSSTTPTFDPALVDRLLRHYGEADGSSSDLPAIRLAPGTSRAMAELMRLFVITAVDRASDEARMQGASEVSPQHLETILAQLLLDF